MTVTGSNYTGGGHWAVVLPMSLECLHHHVASVVLQIRLVLLGHRQFVSTDRAVQGPVHDTTTAARGVKRSVFDWNRPNGVVA